MKENQFLWLQGNDGAFQLVNVDHIVTVDFESGVLRMRLSDSNAVNVSGPARLDLLELFAKHSVLANGEASPELARAVSRAAQDIKSGS